MDSTKSESSGRSTRYSVDLSVLMVTPSGPPMRSSWANEPLWVWNRLPGSSVKVWWRPFASVSWTRSPARSAPVRWAAPCGRASAEDSAGGVVTADRLPAGQRRLDVGEREHADDLPAG